MQGAYLLASIGNKLVTNKEWRCVETMNEEDWYKVKYIDKNWPQAHEKSRGSVVPSLLHKDIYNISRNAMPISASQGSSPKYYCRAWIGHRPSVEEILTRSAFARKTGKHQRLDFHLLKSFLVHDIFDCVTRCLDHEDCVSMNVANSKNSDMLQTCELNRKVKREARGYMLMNKDYDYYDIFRQ
ncbi:uncharacterized protein LOC114528525 [Dendronephthya gigantea]|uniref:uncharacterized protein LOC114528525 n=1 Tax=Dendronephthya gigantea TaxID=151771 RepID=UPI001069E912|nr:uncharacterized protein LOC114528525 [Dendronephthya gigantea]